MEQYLIFQLNNQKFALPIHLIERIVRVVEIRPLAKSSSHILGMIDVQGTAVSVINFRTLLGFPSKEIELSDMLLICKDETRAALLIDRIEDTEYCEQQPYEKTVAIPLPECLDRFIKLHDEMIPVYKLEKIFSQVVVEPTSSETHNATSTSP